MRTRKAPDSNNGTALHSSSELTELFPNDVPAQSPRKRGQQNARSGRSASALGPPSSLTGPPSHRETPAERARERKLRQDPMVIVHNPQLVQCNRCGNKIKLSLKSFWDPFHWNKHKERCLKKSDAAVREMRESSDLPQPEEDSVPPSPQRPSTITLPHAATAAELQAVVAPKPSWPTEVKVHSHSHSHIAHHRVAAPSPSLTPPLIPDEEEDEEEDQSIAGHCVRSPDAFEVPALPDPNAATTRKSPVTPTSHLLHLHHHHAHSGSSPGKAHSSPMPVRASAVGVENGSSKQIHLEDYLYPPSLSNAPHHPSITQQQYQQQQQQPHSPHPSPTHHTITHAHDDYDYDARGRGVETTTLRLRRRTLNQHQNIQPLAHKPYHYQDTTLASVDDVRYWSPPLALGFKESNVRFSHC